MKSKNSKGREKGSTGIKKAEGAKKKRKNNKGARSTGTASTGGKNKKNRTKWFHLQRTIQSNFYIFKTHIIYFQKLT